MTETERQYLRAKFETLKTEAAVVCMSVSARGELTELFAERAKLVGRELELLHAQIQEGKEPE